ncbi:MAG: LysM domain-containing protein [Actinomycetota bacterium]|nr:LysM domain-containing protein [Actinomycetota bacterium]
MAGPWRIVMVLGAAAALAAVAGACASAGSEGRDTLPPINTTTSTTSTTTPPTNRPKTYEIQQGESLSAVAEKFDLNWLELAKFNKIKNPDDIQAGQMINIPAATSTTTV